MKEIDYKKIFGFPLDTDYKEILKLHEMLETAKIPHEMRRKLDGWQVVYPGANWELSAIENAYSIGEKEDLIEIMGLLTEEEKESDSVKGYLTAENVFERIQKHWKKTTAEAAQEVEMQPVKYGEWLYYVESSLIRSHYRCSLCKYPRYEHYAANDFRFCPNCGAKMKKGF